MTGNIASPSVMLRAGRMPLLGFGTWQISDGDVTEAVLLALEAGYRHIDTATMYRNERGIGQALKRAQIDRSELFVTTKLPAERAGREDQTLRASLDALGLDSVDLWLIHWPPSRKVSPQVWEQFVAARDAGLATDIGVSNYSLEEIDELTSIVGETPAVNQIRWSPALFDGEVADGLRQRGVVLEGYSPFKTTDLHDPVLLRVAEQLECTAAQVVIAWHIHHEFVVIPKSAHPERIRANAAGARLTLTDEQVKAVDGLAAGGTRKGRR